jgi:hypothetical protein
MLLFDFIPWSGGRKVIYSITNEFFGFEASSLPAQTANQDKKCHFIGDFTYISVILYERLTYTVFFTHYTFLF